MLAAICALATWRSVRIAWADWLATSGTLQELDHAIRIEPGDGRMLATSAIFRSDNGDLSPAVDRDLERAARLDPLDSKLFMTLGLRAEFRGDKAAAERDLAHAADIDHQFRPAWTLAEFYYRAGHQDRMWPLIDRILKLDPLGFDPGPVFDLCWNALGDPAKIRALIPPPRLLEYLSYLIRTNRADAALDVWPAALVLSAPPGRAAAALKPFPDFLAGAGRIPEAVRAWNELVSRGIVQSGRLEPATGVSIADPGFVFPPAAGVFSWQIANTDGVLIANGPGGLRAEFDGNEPESFELASVLAPVLPGREYRLIWTADASRLASPQDAGFSFQVGRTVLPSARGPESTQCPPLLTQAACQFAAGPDTRAVRVDLMYSRASGTTRAQGTLRVLKAALELAR